MNDKDTRNAVGTLLADMVSAAELAKTRRFKTGPWCYYCGIDSPAERCGCFYSGSFGCNSPKIRVCVTCRKAHEKIAAHLTQMFAAKRVNRVSSKRGHAYRFLFFAAKQLAEKDATSRGEVLAMKLAAADAYDDPEDVFRTLVLASFRLARFVAWQQLAAALEDQVNEHLSFSLSRYFLATEAGVEAEVTRIAKMLGLELSSESDLKPGDEQFYT